MSRVWICEKPKQAGSIAEVLGIRKRGQGLIETNDGIVTWAYGHLFEQFAPDDYDERWQAWRADTLPMVPTNWKHRPVRARAGQLALVVNAIKSASEVVIATDIDREGEAIAREILEHARYRGPIRRLWASALDAKSLARAIPNLRDGEATEKLYWAAQARSRADWIVGMNLTRAATLASQARGGTGVRTVGRVQTPTLALVVRRDNEIATFQAKDYFEIVAQVSTSAGIIEMRHAPRDERRIMDRAVADQMCAQALGAVGPLNVRTERKQLGPPALFSLPGLQQAASKRFGFTADQTLAVAQSLYETHGLLSYPRSDCTFMPDEQRPDIPEILGHLSRLDGLGPLAEAIADAPVVRSSTFDSARITAHHAIVPTLTPANIDGLSPDERRLYLLVAQQYIAALSPDYVYDETHIDMNANGVPLHVRGRATVAAGWRAVLGSTDDEEDARGTLPALSDGTEGKVHEARVDAKRTQPPKPYTEGTLIGDMNAIAKFCDDPKIKRLLRETSGIGTGATQAGIIKNLRERGLLAAQGKRAIVSTQTGRALIAALPAIVSDPAVTALWEERLTAIATGDVNAEARDAFVADIAIYVGGLLSVIQASASASTTETAEQDQPRPAHLAGPPTPKMLQLAESIANQKGLKKLPENVRTSFADCRAWLDEHASEAKSDREHGRPTPKQIAVAQRIANEQKLVLPADCQTDRVKCSAFIENHSRRTKRK